jgi:class 3 adenylate cyclase/predicted ATPase
MAARSREIEVRRVLDLCVSTLEQRDLLHLFLTDGRAVVRHATMPVALASVGDGPALGHMLLTGPVGEFLMRSPLRGLRLRLPMAFDSWPWEQASVGGAPLGESFAVSRHLLTADGEDDEDDADKYLDALAPESDALQWLQCSCSHGATEATAPVVPGLMWHHWEPTGPRALTPPDTWTSCQVVRMSEAWPALLALQVDAPQMARLWIVDDGAPAADPSWVHARCRDGDGVLVLPSRAPGEPDIAPALCVPLAAGLTVAEAVRRLRCTERGDWARARLYGCADLPLVQPRGTSAGDDVRRQVTALSFDVVNSTSLMARIGEELYARRLSRLHERIRQQVLAHGGKAGDPQGNDGVMCFFGHPVATEDSAVRAVTAALAISALGTRSGMPLRVGMATGQVVVHQGQPFGTRVHLAARLQHAAEVGGVLVCDLTQSLTSHAFEFGVRKNYLNLKGFANASKAFAVRAARPRTSEHLGPRLLPLVGRSQELGLLETLWGEAVQRQPRVVLVRGEAGIGKTRLLREMRQRLRGLGHEPLEFRCSVDGSFSAFHGVADALVRLLGLTRLDGGGLDLARIEQALPPAMRSPETAALVAGVITMSATDARQTPERLRERTLEVLVAWFWLEAQSSPMCLIVEDLHWIDPSTGEFLERLMAHGPGLAAMLVLTQRSDAQAVWQPHHVDRHIELQGLGEEAARQLIAHACRPQILPTTVVRQLAARSDGVPLFLEESARMAAEQHSEATPTTGLVLDVPARLQDLLMLRLDRLGSAKRFAQWGAVLGRAFPLALLTRVLAEAGERHLPQDIEAPLAQLVRSGLLIEIERPDGPELLFKHALVRDVAYQSLWQSERRRMHETTAIVLRQHSAALVQRQPELLALHLAEAGAHADALLLWERAARNAAARSAHGETISHLQQAMDLLPRLTDEGQRHHTELRLCLLMASRLIATEGYGAEAVARVYARAAELVAEVGDPQARLKIELGLEGYHLMRADFAAARGCADRAVAMARDNGDVLGHVQTGWAMANVLFHQGALVSALQRMDECLARYRPDMHRAAGVQNPAVMCLCYAAWGLWNHGHADTALERIASVLQLAQDCDHPFSIGEAHAFAASVLHFRGETAAALAHAEQGVAVCAEAGFSVWHAHARIMRGRLWCEQGRSTEGLDEMRAGYAQWVRTGAEVTRPFYLAMQAEGLALVGDFAQALVLVHDALTRVARTGERYHEPELRRLSGELAWRLDLGAAVAAEATLQEALELARRQQTLAFELRSACSLARLWRAQGRSAAARALLASVLARCVQGQGTRDVREAQALLAALVDSSLDEGVPA